MSLYSWNVIATFTFFFSAADLDASGSNNFNIAVNCLS